MSDVVADLKQVSISRMTLGLVLGVVTFSAVITWNAAQVAGRISALEDKVEVVERNTGTDSAVLARLDTIEAGIATNADSLENLRLARVEDSRNYATSVMVETMAGELEALRRLVADYAEAVDEELDAMHIVFDDLYGRVNLTEDACRTKNWCNKYFEENG